MTHDAMTEHYEEITVCGKPALFTSIRIKRDTVPEAGDKHALQSIWRNIGRCRVHEAYRAGSQYLL